jgi:hypothetical protein
VPRRSAPISPLAATSGTADKTPSSTPLHWRSLLAKTLAAQGSGPAFHADHPLFYLLRDPKDQGAVLFLGRVGAFGGVTVRRWRRSMSPDIGGGRRYIWLSGYRLQRVRGAQTLLWCARSSRFSREDRVSGNYSVVHPVLSSQRTTFPLTRCRRTGNLTARRGGGTRRAEAKWNSSLTVVTRFVSPSPL